MALFERWDGWQTADFDAFAEPRWKSNRFNLDRTRVRNRLQSLLEQAAAGLDLTGIGWWSSRVEPSLVNGHKVERLRVLLTRPQAEREAMEQANPGVSATEPDRCHPWVGLEIDASGVALVAQVDERIATWAARDSAEVPGIAEVSAWLAVALPKLRAAVAATTSAVPSTAVPPSAPLADLPSTAAEPEAPVVASESAPAPPAPTAVAAARPASNRHYRPAPLPSRAPAPLPDRTPALERERAPVERIQPPTWRPHETEVGRALTAQQQQQQQRPPWPPRERPAFARPEPDRPPSGRDRPTSGHDRPPPRPTGRPFELGPDRASTPAVTTLAPGAKVQLRTGLFAGKVGTVTDVRGDELQVMLGLMTVKVAKVDVQLT
jgi:transcription antitermination factor NusG